MPEKKRKEINEESVVKVAGGLRGPAGDGNDNAEPTMQWCDKCQEQTPHNEDGECIICIINNAGARYRF